MSLICEETCEQVPSCRATFTLCRKKHIYDGPPRWFIPDWLFWCDCPAFKKGNQTRYGMNKTNRYGVPSTCCHVKTAWSATVIAQEWNASERNISYIPALHPVWQDAIRMHDTLNNVVGGVGRFTFIPTPGEIEKYNITTHYTVKSCGKDVSCTCKGFIYHKNCKHVNRIIKREKAMQNRRDLGISLAVLYISQIEK